MDSLGRMLLIAGAILALAGLALLVADRLGPPLGRLPGDIRIERDGFQLYFPLGSSPPVGGSSPSRGAIAVSARRRSGH